MLRVPVLEKPLRVGSLHRRRNPFRLCGKKPMRCWGTLRKRLSRADHVATPDRVFAGPPTAVFFDVGALFGYFGLLALAVSKGEAKIFEFEMNPRAFAALNENFAANTHLRREAIVAFQGAVGRYRSDTANDQVQGNDRGFD